MKYQYKERCEAIKITKETPVEELETFLGDRFLALRNNTLYFLVNDSSAVDYYLGEGKYLVKLSAYSAKVDGKITVLNIEHFENSWEPAVD